MISKLREIVEKATPGPWQAGPKFFGTCRGQDSEILGSGEKNDIDFVATFNPALVSKLLDVVEAASNTLNSHLKNKQKVACKDMAALFEAFRALESFDAD